MSNNDKLSLRDFTILATAIQKADSALEESESDGCPRCTEWMVCRKHLPESNSAQIVEAYEQTVVALMKPLMFKGLHDIFHKEPLVNESEDFDAAFFAGIRGLCRGIRKYNPEKDSGASVHYIARWFYTYAKREVEFIAAGKMGINTRKYMMFKKIAAVRMKLDKQLNRRPTTDEIYNFFQSGKADYNKRGKSSPSGKANKANSAITKEDIEEQDQIYNAFYRRGPQPEDISEKRQR